MELKIIFQIKKNIKSLRKRRQTMNLSIIDTGIFAVYGLFNLGIGLFSLHYS